jgi:putative FmdB family regulatory protein
MPLYEYECTACKRHTEKIQKFSDTEITVCPHCGGKLERVISAPAISFKGGGWYSDLYSSTKPAASGAGDSAAPATADAGSTSGAGGTKENAAAPSAATSSPAAAPPSAAPTKAAVTTPSKS